MLAQIVTANNLATGEVVFYATAHGWTNRFHKAQILNNLTEAEALLAQAQIDETNNLVVGAYLIDVTIDNNRPVPVSLREKLRVNGPSIHPQFHKQSHDGVKAA